MMRTPGIVAAVAILCCLAAPSTAQEHVIQDVTIDWSTHIRDRNGSDNWPMTWADDNHQYTSWGDGGGFGGNNAECRVSLGFGRVEGPKDGYEPYNVWGCSGTSCARCKHDVEPYCLAENCAQFAGKCYGMLAVDHDGDGSSSIFMWNMREGDYFIISDLYRSDDYSASYASSGVTYAETDCAFSVPTFIQMGQNYEANTDGYIYMMAPDGQCDRTSSHPGGMADGADLIRVPLADIEDKGAYEYFAGMSGGSPTWTSNIADREYAFYYDENGDGNPDTDKIFWAFSVTYHPGLDVYLLWNRNNGNPRPDGADAVVDLWEGDTPWGPWRLVKRWNNFGGFGSLDTTYWYYPAPKWFSGDNSGFMLIFAGKDDNDSWNSVEGTFHFGGGGPDVTPPDPVTGFSAAVAGADVTLSWNHSASSDNEGTTVRFRTDQAPTSPSDGTLVCDRQGAPGAADSCVHGGLAAGTYHYTAFSYDTAGNRGAGVTTSATVAGTPPGDVQNLRRTDEQPVP